jgi:uncharacterized protein (DUF427 family)
MDNKTQEWVEATTGQQVWWPTLVQSERWVRVRFDDIVIAESRSAVLLLQYGPPPKLPTYFFSPEDIDGARLVNRREGPDGATMWDVEGGDGRARSAAWTHPLPVDDLQTLEGMVTFDWWGALQWFEEDERVFAHARDPFKRVDVIPSSRHVEVFMDGTRLADSHSPLLLFETYLPTRYYLPPEDVSFDRLTSSATTTMCPYKGVSRHWAIEGANGNETDIAWAYPDPVPENPRIKDRVCFYNERVDLVVDGEPQPRPRTPWGTP